MVQAVDFDKVLCFRTFSTPKILCVAPDEAWFEDLVDLGISVDATPWRLQELTARLTCSLLLLLSQGLEWRDSGWLRLRPHPLEGLELCTETLAVPFPAKLESTGAVSCPS